MPEFKLNSPLMKSLGSLKWTVWILLGMVAIMAYATYVEAHEGHEAAMAKGFHSIPMDILIVMLAVNVTACTIGRAPYRPHQIPWLITHLGLLLTMAGTIVSHQTNVVGQIILRVGQPISAATVFTEGPVPMEIPLGFTLYLDSFEAKFYPGTGKASDYISQIRMVDPEKGINDTVIVRVNHPIIHRGWNISQSSFFPGDNQATILGANKDPGTPLSYSGFLTIFLGLVGLFFFKPWLKEKFPPPPKVKPTVTGASKPVTTLKADSGVTTMEAVKEPE